MTYQEFLQSKIDIAEETGFEIDPATGKWMDLSGVNITLGLPIIRTSVDHGTAFDIAGTGVANERSLIEAIEFAEKLAANRQAG